MHTWHDKLPMIEDINTGTSSPSLHKGVIKNAPLQQLWHELRVETESLWAIGVKPFKQTLSCIDEVHVAVDNLRE